LRALPKPAPDATESRVPEKWNELLGLLPASVHKDEFFECRRGLEWFDIDESLHILEPHSTQRAAFVKARQPFDSREGLQEHVLRTGERRHHPRMFELPDLPELEVLNRVFPLDTIE
jgi:hypothetical protein